MPPPCGRGRPIWSAGAAFVWSPQGPVPSAACQGGKALEAWKTYWAGSWAVGVATASKNRGMVPPQMP